MAENSWPFEGLDTTELQYSKLFSALADTGVISGLTLSVLSGLNVSLGLGQAVVQGFYYELVTSAKSLVVPASHPSQVSKHYVVLKLDLTANSITAQIKAGTIGGNSFPALVQNSNIWEHPIHEILVPAGAANLIQANLTSRLTGTGLRLVPFEDASRPAPSAAVVVGVNTTTRKLELWASNAWSVLTPDLSWANVTGKPTTFPPASHSHDWGSISDKPTTFVPSAHDINSNSHTGILTIAKGGTGATSKSAALNALGVFVGKTQPTMSSGDVWIKYA